MAAKKLTDALKGVRALIWELYKNLGNGPSVPEASGSFFMPGVGGLTLDGAEMDSYSARLDELVEIAHRDGQLSRPQIEEHFRRAVLSALPLVGGASSITKAAMAPRVDKAIAELEQALLKPAKNWTVYLPVEDIVVRTRPVLVGRVSFLSNAKNRSLARMGVESDRLLTANTAHSDEEKQTLKEHWRGQLAHIYAGKRAVAKVTVKAVDAAAAQTLAARHLFEARQLLSFYSLLLFHADEPMDPWERGRAFTVAAAAGAMTISGHEPYPIELSELWASTRAIRNGLHDVSALLREGTRSEVEDRIIDGVLWAGRGARAEDRASALLFYMIALETVVLGYRGEKSMTLQLRCAHLLGRDVEGRRSICDQISSLYRRRSDVVHEGDSEVTVSEVSMTYSIVLGVTRTLVFDKAARAMTSEELKKWFEDKLLA